VNLAAMVSLVIEQVGASYVGGLDISLSLIVGVGEGASEEAVSHGREERLDAGVLGDAGGSERGEIVEEDEVEGRCDLSAAFESRHPDPVAEQDVIQQSVDAAEGAWARFPVFGVV